MTPRLASLAAKTEKGKRSNAVENQSRTGLRKAPFSTGSLLVLLVLLLVVPGVVSAANLFVNPGFETGDLGGWTIYEGTSTTVFVSNTAQYTGTYGAHFGTGGDADQNVTLAQTIDLTDVPNVTFWSKYGEGIGDVYIDTTLVLNNINDGATWKEHIIDTSLYSGSHTVYFGLYHGDTMDMLFDNVSAYSSGAGSGAPTASFTMNRVGVIRIPRMVTFTDTSTGTPTSWVWDFGDGSG